MISDVLRILIKELSLIFHLNSKAWIIQSITDFGFDFAISILRIVSYQCLLMNCDFDYYNQ